MRSNDPRRRSRIITILDAAALVAASAGIVMALGAGSARRT